MQSLVLRAQSTPNNDTALLHIPHRCRREPATWCWLTIIIVIVVGLRSQSSPLALPRLPADGLPHSIPDAGGRHAERRYLERPHVVPHGTGAGVTIRAWLAFAHDKKQILTAGTDGHSLKTSYTTMSGPYLISNELYLIFSRIGTLNNALPSAAAMDGNLALGNAVIKGIHFKVEEVQLASKFTLAVEAAKTKQPAFAYRDRGAAARGARCGGKLAPYSASDIKSPEIVGAFAAGQAAAMNEESTISFVLLINGVSSKMANNWCLGNANFSAVAYSPSLPALSAARTLRRKVAGTVGGGGGVVASRGRHGQNCHTRSRWNRVKVGPGIGARVEDPDTAGLFKRCHIGSSATAEDEDAATNNCAGMANTRSRNVPWDGDIRSSQTLPLVLDSHLCVFLFIQAFFVGWAS
nr:uncharacterized protein CTRU02_00147 [Colletotrichum truncatum]KAF6801398.1 hypothetical protein CTRU02_00147 [Colletotrichum truncatum]